MKHPKFKLLRNTIIELRRADECTCDTVMTTLHAQFDNKKKLNQELLEDPPSLKPIPFPTEPSILASDDVPVPTVLDPPPFAPPIFETPQAPIFPLKTIFAAADNGTGPPMTTELPDRKTAKAQEWRVATASKTVKAQEWPHTLDDKRPPPEPPPPTIYKLQEWQGHNKQQLAFSLLFVYDNSSALNFHCISSLNHGLARLACRSVLEVSLPQFQCGSKVPPFQAQQAPSSH